MAIKIEIKDNKLIMTADIEEQESQSGKMLLIVKSGSFVDAGVTYKGKPVKMNINIGTFTKK